MAFLYISPKGVPWTKHSYSAGLDFEKAPLLYYLRRIQGWRVNDNKASLKFGKALEEAIQHYHDNNGLGGIECFLQKWAEFESDKEMRYTKTEKDWASLNRAGREMMRLYEIRQPSLPIPLGAGSVFQREISKEVFPGDPNYGEIEDAGKLDVIAYNPPDHPMLPKLTWRPEYGALRPLIVDIKTSALDFPDQPGIAAFDKQLRHYSWLSGIHDVSLLWFKKCGHHLSKGSSVTLLQDAFGEGFKASDEVVVAAVDDEESVWIVRNDFYIELMEKAQGRKEDGKLDASKEAKIRKIEWLMNNALRVPTNWLTRQRLQFNAGFVTNESADDAGAIAARQIVEIVNAWKTKRYPQTFGIRFPSDDRSDPYFRAFVLGDEAFKKQNFTKTAEESFDDLWVDDSEEEI